MTRPQAKDPPGISTPKVTTEKFDPRGHDMVPVGLLAFIRGRPSPTDVYLPIKNPGDDQFNMTLVCHKGQPIADNWWALFGKAGVRSVCVQPDDVCLLLEQLKDRAASATQVVKAEIFKEIAALSVRVLYLGQARDRAQVDKVAGLAKSTVGLFLQDTDVMDNLARVLTVSHNIFDHSVNVCLLSLVLGRALGLDSKKLTGVGVGALLHDIGMGRVPAEVVNKEGPLDDSEWELVRKHPTWGHQQVALSPQIPYDALNVVLNHHERSDGSGYPSGLKGASIPLVARLVSVVDMYDAITSPRPYRPAKSPSEAISIMLETMEDKADKDLIARFVRAQAEAMD